MVSACATIMLVPPVLWLFLLIIKRDDHEFLQLVMRPLRTLELLFWVPGFVAGVASALLSYRGPLLLLGVTLGSVGAAFGMMKYWIKRQLGLEESSAEGWWPAKHD